MQSIPRYLFGYYIWVLYTPPCTCVWFIISQPLYQPERKEKKARETKKIRFMREKAGKGKIISFESRWLLDLRTCQSIYLHV